MIANRAARTALLALALAVLPASAGAAPPSAHAPGPPLRTPAHALKPADGYYDDSFTLDAGGQHLTVIRTDGTQSSTIEIVDLSTGQIARALGLGQSDQIPDRVELLPDGKNVLLVVRDAGTDKAWAAIVDPAGRLVAKTPVATAFARTDIPAADAQGAPEPALVGLEKRGGGRAAIGTTAETGYTVSAYRLANLAPLGKPHSYRVGAGNDLKGTDISVVGFFDGYARILGQRAGAYDKGQDFRRPSRMVVFDALTGKVASEKEIDDIYAWTRTTKLRAENANRTAFAQVTAEHDGIEIIDPAGNKLPVTTAVPFRLYDPTSLRDQEGPEANTLYFSIAVDPVNPDAIARQKTDTPMLDLYSFDLGSRKARHRVRILLTRPVLWKAGAGKLCVLKRFKSFPRGGDELDVYDLP
ncbi:MAG TPA: hypothetical protein VMU50_01955 [Polyangia bacterium]|nr:hypothetical protein [Polyangia bacterium]